MQPWMKMMTDLDNKPEFQGLCDLLARRYDAAIVDDLIADAVLGKLWRFWRYVENSTTTGDLPHTSRQGIDRVCGLGGFADMMIRVGWLRDNDGKLTVPNFDRHMGPAAKKRAQEQVRQKRSRSRHDASVTEPVPDKQEDTPTGSHTPAISQDQALTVFNEYPTHRRVDKKRSLKAIQAAVLRIARERKLDKDEALDWLRERTRLFAASPAGNRGKYTKHCATWMNAGSYDDDPEIWKLKDETGNDQRTDRARREHEEDIKVTVESSGGPGA